MFSGFFNYQSRIAESWLDRTSFTWNWWRIYARDPHWVPPYYPHFRRELETRHNSHLARMDPIYLYIEALPGGSQSGRPKVSGGPAEPVISGGYFEQPVAAGVLIQDPRRQDGSAYLSLLHCANDAESLERLLSKAADLLQGTGSHSLIFPVGLSPHLESGLLQDHWDRIPPLHTAYNPPYLPEIARPLGEPLSRSRLYELEVLPEPVAGSQTQAQIEPLIPLRLGEDLLSLFSGVISNGDNDPPVDREEASFILRWLSSWPVKACVASSGSQPAGFLILGPDLAPYLKRAKGGRSLYWRAWLRQSARSPVAQGRIFFGGVLPHWRRQGIGRQLLHYAAGIARDEGWEKLAVGPVPEDSAAAELLKGAGARPCQSYQRYHWEL